MFKYILTFLLLTAPLSAQSVDLQTIPEDYAFVSVSPDVRVTIRFMERDGDSFLFLETAVYTDGTQDVSELWVNSQSQTTAWVIDGAKTRFSPHDCAPSMGECHYTWFHPEGTFEMKTITHLVGDVWVSDEYFKDGDVWAFWEKDCTTYDQFGFWIDFVRISNDGEIWSGARERPGENRLTELHNMCQPSRLTS